MIIVYYDIIQHNVTHTYMCMCVYMCIYIYI